jgi:hypothetical protein
MQTQNVKVQASEDVRNLMEVAAGLRTLRKLQEDAANQLVYVASSVSGRLWALWSQWPELCPVEVGRQAFTAKKAAQARRNSLIAAMTAGTGADAARIKLNLAEAKSELAKAATAANVFMGSITK